MCPLTDRLLHRSDPLRTPFRSLPLGSWRGARLSGQCHLSTDPRKQPLPVSRFDTDVITRGECDGSR
jgi:hypothetical protein